MHTSNHYFPPQTMDEICSPWEPSTNAYDLPSQATAGVDAWSADGLPVFNAEVAPTQTQTQTEQQFQALDTQLPPSTMTTTAAPTASLSIIPDPTNPTSSITIRVHPFMLTNPTIMSTTTRWINGLNYTVSEHFTLGLTSISPLFTAGMNMGTIPQPAAAPVSNSAVYNQTAGNDTQAASSLGQGPSKAVAYASIAPAVFVVLVLIAIYMRQRRKSKRVLEAAGNLRSEGVGGEGFRSGRIPRMPIPVSPKTPRRVRSWRGGGGIETTGVGGNGLGEGVEMQQLRVDDPDAIMPATPRTPYHQIGGLGDSDIYSPRYTYSHAYSTPPKQTDPPRDGCSISPDLHPTLEHVELRSVSPITLPSTLPPLPSPDIGEPSRWMAEPNSPKPCNLQPEPNLQTPTSQRRITPSTPFHTNYRRASTRESSAGSDRTVPSQEAKRVVLARMERSHEVGGRKGGRDG